MRVILDHGDFNFTYTLTPVNKRTQRKLEEDTGESSIQFVQTDWEYPALARDLGWNMKIGRERCQHRSTDGTVDCRECDKKVSDFIAAAADWLDNHCGCVFTRTDLEYD